jgi:hypothetical protein
MIEAVPDGADRMSNHRIELWATLLLGLATVAIALATFRGTVYDDRVAENFHVALVEEGSANDLFGQFDSTFAFEQSLFIEWLVAMTEGNETASTLIANAMSQGLRETSIEWLNDDSTDALTPFDYDDTRLDSTEYLLQGRDLAASSDAFEQAARDADSAGDLLGLAQVLFAITLFFAGMAVILKTPQMQQSVLVLGAVVLIVGVVFFVVGETA